MATATAKATQETTKHENLASALVAFQAELPDVRKNATAEVGKYGYSYVTLTKLVEILFPVLTKHGLAYTSVADTKDGLFGLKATLIHESGETFEGFHPLGNPNAPQQALGSAISYARRYSLMSLAGVAPDEDDDGKAAADAVIKEPVAASGKEDLASVKADITEILNDPTNTLDGDSANTVMQEVAPNKTVAEWTLTDLKKGREKLKALAKANPAKGA